MDDVRDIQIGFPAMIGYASAEEAIHAALGSERYRVAKKDSRLLAGTTIEKFKITDRVVSLSLSGDFSVEFSATKSTADWKIVRTDEMIFESKTGRIPKIRLHGSNDHVYEWDHVAILESTLHVPISELWGGESFVNLMFKDRRILRVDTAMNILEDFPFLYYEFSE